MNLEDYNSKMYKYDFVCPECNSDEIKILEDEIGKCNRCGTFFDLYDKPLMEKVLRTKPKKKYNDDDDINDE